MSETSDQAFERRLQEGYECQQRLRSENQALRERIGELERVLANLGIQLTAGGSGDPAGGEVE
jgi:hypothetical protein